MSPRHHTSVTANDRIVADPQIASPAPTMILRDTSIREPNLPSKDSSFFRNSMAMYSNNSGLGATTQQLPTTLIGRDCNSPYGTAPYQPNDITSIPSYLAGPTGLGSRENNASILRESTNRIASHRYLASGLDQRIIKQSSEDCRRLLQQVGPLDRLCSCRYN